MHVLHHQLAARLVRLAQRYDLLLELELVLTEALGLARHLLVQLRARVLELLDLVDQQVSGIYLPKP